MRRFVVHLTDVAGSQRCRTIAKLGSGWRVIVGVDAGQLDGGVHVDFDESDLPVEIRVPNATFFVTLE